LAFAFWWLGPSHLWTLGFQIIAFTVVTTPIFIVVILLLVGPSNIAGVATLLKGAAGSAFVIGAVFSIPDLFNLYVPRSLRKRSTPSTPQPHRDHPGRRE
jgi:hypothetical protein